MLFPDRIEKPVHFIDVGANVGQTCSWAKKFYGECLEKIDAFEPLEENLEELRWNHGADPRILIHQEAAWIFDEFRNFYPQVSGCRTGSSLVYGKTSTDTNNPRVIQCIDIIRWLQENTRREKYHTIFKLDVEGAEYDILPVFFEKGAHVFVDELFIEFHAAGKVSNFNQDLINRVNDEYRSILTNWGGMCPEVEQHRCS